ncbi:hypothetical protein AAG906_027420 [Vitis piasezkii]
MMAETSSSYERTMVGDVVEIVGSDLLSLHLVFSLAQRFFFKTLFGTYIFAICQMFAKKTVSSAQAGEVREKATDKLDVKEFRDRFSIPNGVSVELLNEEVPFSTEKVGGHAIIFTKEHFNAGLRFPLPALFKEFLHFSKIHCLHSSQRCPVLMGCSVINMLVQTRPHATGGVLSLLPEEGKK